MFKNLISIVRGDFSAVAKKVRHNKGLMSLFLIMAFCVVGSMSAHAEVTLPTTVDVTEYITAGVALMALVVAAALGGYTAFLIVRKAFKWLGRALG